MRQTLNPREKKPVTEAFGKIMAGLKDARAYLHGDAPPDGDGVASAVRRRHSPPSRCAA